MVCELIMNPSASIVVSESVLVMGAKMGVMPSSSGPNNRTWSADPTWRGGRSLPPRARGSLHLSTARACCLVGGQSPKLIPFHEAGSSAFIHQLPQPREAGVVMGRPVPEGGAAYRCFRKSTPACVASAAMASLRAIDCF